MQVACNHNVGIALVPARVSVRVVALTVVCSNRGTACIGQRNYNVMTLYISIRCHVNDQWVIGVTLIMIGSGEAAANLISPA